MANHPGQKYSVFRVELIKMMSRLDVALQLSTNVTEAKAKLEDAKGRQEEAKKNKEEAIIALNGANAMVQMLSREVEEIKKQLLHDRGISL